MSFGGGGGSDERYGGSRVMQEMALTPQQQRLANPIIDMIIEQVGQPAPAFGDLTAEEQAGIRGQVPDYLAQADPRFAEMGMGALENLSGGQEDVFDPIYDYTQRMFEDVVAPEVMERFAGMGAAMSGGAAQALAREGGTLALGMGAEMAPLWLQSQAALPGLAQGLGAYEQQTRQEPLTVAQEIFEAQQPYANPYLNLTEKVLPYSGVHQANLLGTRQDDENFGEGMLRGMAPMLGAGIGGAMMGWCDERIKEHFEPIEDALDKIDKITGNKYNYIGDKERSAGVIAQDIEKVLPEAVKEVNGVKFVRYDAVIALLVEGMKELRREMKKGA